MVVCHCLAVNDRAIKQLVADRPLGSAPVTVDEVKDLCGAGGKCGNCHDSIEWVLARAAAERPGEVPVALSA